MCPWPGPTENQENGTWQGTEEEKACTAARTHTPPAPPATHIIHTPAAMFRGRTVMQLKRPETAQAWKRDRSRHQQQEGTEPARKGPSRPLLTPDACFPRWHLQVSPVPPEASETSGTAGRPVRLQLREPKQLAPGRTARVRLAGLEGTSPSVLSTAGRASEPQSYPHPPQGTEDGDRQESGGLGPGRRPHSLETWLGFWLGQGLPLLEQKSGSGRPRRLCQL